MNPLTPEPHAPAPHPAAPADIVENFQSFLAKLQSSSGGADSPSSTPKGQSTSQSAQGKTPEQTGAGSSSSGGKSAAPSKPSKPADFEEFYEAPRYYWQQREFSDREIEAIMVSRGLDGIRVTVSCSGTWERLRRQCEG